MRYVAAALLCGLAGGEVNAAAIGKILKAAGVDADSAEVGNYFSIWLNWRPYRMFQRKSFIYKLKYLITIRFGITDILKYHNSLDLYIH